MRLDVLHVLATNQRRGAEIFGVDLHHALVQRGFRLEICCVKPGDGEQRVAIPALGASRVSPSGLRKLRGRARHAGAVVAHGSSTLVACGIALLSTGVPFVYLSIGDPRYWAGSRFRRLRTGLLLRRAAAVVAIAPSARDVLIEHYRLDPERVRVIPNGRSGDVFVPAQPEQRAAVRERLGVPDSTELVAVVGALSREKRVDVAIEAIGRLADVMLLIAGDGPERPRLTAQAEHLAPDRVRFLGATDDPAEVLAAADAVVLSSDSEGVPGVLIEAGLAGLPVVATDVGWVRDVVQPEITGLLVPPGQPTALAHAIRLALDRRDELGTAGRRHCLAEYDMPAVTDKWVELLSEVTRHQ